MNQSCFECQKYEHKQNQKIEVLRFWISSINLLMKIYVSKTKTLRGNKELLNVVYNDIYHINHVNKKVHLQLNSVNVN